MTREEKIRLIQLLRIKKQRAELRQQESNDPELSESAETAPSLPSQIPAEDAPEVVDWSQPQEVEQIMPQMPEKTIGSKIIGAVEAGRAIGQGVVSGMTLQPVGTLQQAAKEVIAGQYGTPEAADRIESAAMKAASIGAYMPKTDAGKEYLGDAADFLGRFPAYMGIQAPAVSAARAGAKLQMEGSAARGQQRVEGLQSERGALMDIERRAAGKSLAPTATKAADGSESSTAALARAAEVDPKKVAAAETLGINAPAPLVSSSKEFQELSAVLKKIPDGQVSSAWLRSVEEIGQKADDAMRQVSTMDKASVSANVQKKIESAIKDLVAQEELAYGAIKQNAPADSRVNTSKTMEYLNGRIKDLDGDETLLSNLERRVLKRVRPEEKTVTRLLVVPGMPQKETKIINPAYGRVDDARRIAGLKTKQFSNANDIGMAKNLYKLLEDDLDTAHQSFGPGFSTLRDQAKGLTKAKYKLLDDMTALFGQKAESMLPTIDSATGALSKNNYDAFAKMMAAVPEDMRSEVAITALRSKLMSNGKLDHAQFANFYDALKSNPRSYSAIMRHIPKEQRKQLNAVARLSMGIRDLETTNPAKAAAIRAELGDTQGLMTKLYRFTTRPVAMIAARATNLTQGGLPYAISSFLNAERRGKKLKSVDDLVASQEFYDLATKGQKSSVENLARSAQFINFAKENGVYGNFAQRVQWITDAMKTTVDDQEAEQEPVQ